MFYSISRIDFGDGGGGGGDVNYECLECGVYSGKYGTTSPYLYIKKPCLVVFNMFFDFNSMLQGEGAWCS